MSRCTGDTSCTYHYWTVHITPDDPAAIHCAACGTFIRHPQLRWADTDEWICWRCVYPNGYYSWEHRTCYPICYCEPRPIRHMGRRPSHREALRYNHRRKSAV